MLIVASEEAVNKHGFTPLARLVNYSVAGVDPSIMGIGPADAIKMLLAKEKMNLKDIDLVEVNLYFECNACLKYVLHENKKGTKIFAPGTL